MTGAARHPVSPTLRRRARDEGGEMLLELVVSLIFLTVAVGGLMSVFTATMISMRETGVSGTAQTLVERQMEVYKKLPYASLKLSSVTQPAAGDVYFTSPPPTVQVGFTNVTGGATAASACSYPTYALGECAVQTFTGPDQRTYRVDSYIVSATPPGGRPGVRISVAVRPIVNGVVGAVKAQATSAFDPASPPS